MWLAREAFCRVAQNRSLAMSNALRRSTGRSFCAARRMSCRSFVAENQKKMDGGGGGLCIACPNDDSEIRVWWDVQTSRVPKRCDGGIVMSNIRDALRWVHCFGPVEFWGYGDMTRLPSQTLRELHNGGARLRHVPSENMLRDELMTWDMIAWSKDHPPPAVHMVITSNHFSTRLNSAVDGLRGEGYSMLLALPYDGTSIFHSANALWHWETFLAGSEK